MADRMWSWLTACSSPMTWEKPKNNVAGPGNILSFVALPRASGNLLMTSSEVCASETFRVRQIAQLGGGGGDGASSVSARHFARLLGWELAPNNTESKSGYD